MTTDVVIPIPVLMVLTAGFALSVRSVFVSIRKKKAGKKKLVQERLWHKRDGKYPWWTP